MELDGLPEAAAIREAKEIILYNRDNAKFGTGQKFPERLIRYIYSDSRGEDFYPTMEHELATRAVQAMVVLKSPEESRDDLSAQDTLESLGRGANGYLNLRSKYHRKEHIVGDRVFTDWQEKTLPVDELKKVTIRLTQQNVFHASDGSHDGIGTLLRLRESRNREARGFFQDPIDPRVNPVVDKLDKILERHKGERDMSKITREWRVNTEMPENDKGLPIRQVYTWLLTHDDEVVIVSKDGENWQLPGGKPDGNENAIQAATREVLEETGIDMTPYIDDLHFFGAYTINDPAPVDQPPRYRQVRSWLQLPLDARELALSTSGESHSQRPEDAVRFIRSVPAKEILEFIPWLEQADEYKYLKRNKIIESA